ncbi:hypothetical protein [Streptomyces broussonetiae]|uniref:DUF1508 domain-containing protein n=1 Tax=Streptomyces broussonetiae TaxID=2686304 RepID=A0ABV5ELD3_9ACTN
MREAAEQCPAGYEDDTGLNPTVEPLPDPAPGAGDEAVAYRRELSGTVFWYQVVRSGSDVAVFGWKSLFAHRDAGAAPDDVITAQLEKLAGTG